MITRAAKDSRVRLCTNNDEVGKRSMSGKPQKRRGERRIVAHSVAEIEKSSEVSKRKRGRRRKYEERGGHLLGMDGEAGDGSREHGKKKATGARLDLRFSTTYW